MPSGQVIGRIATTTPNREAPNNEANSRCLPGLHRNLAQEGPVFSCLQRPLLLVSILGTLASPARLVGLEARRCG